tara:strand:- start:349 stop:597 length:249 start_codon:yes stop_codon:yes gene_type:complete
MLINGSTKTLLTEASNLSHGRAQTRLGFAKLELQNLELARPTSVIEKTKNQQQLDERVKVCTNHPKQPIFMRTDTTLLCESE